METPEDTNRDETVIGGRYKVIERIGTGSMGVVYKAFDPRLNNKFAIKVLSADLGIADEAIVRFQREAKAASQLKHPGLITVYDFGITGSGKPYMVLELIDGEPLEQIIKRRGVLTPEEAIPILKHICGAMEYAHKHGVIHRDIKSSNVMISGDFPESFSTKILDFGIAKFIGDDSGKLTQPGLVIGTAAYMSPEQASGRAIDARSDIYSLGCLMYEMLTGIQPLRGSTYVETLTNHINEPAPLLSDANPDLDSPRLESIVARALEKDPQDRFASMNEFSQALAPDDERNFAESMEVGSTTGGAARQLKKGVKQSIIALFAAMFVGLPLIVLYISRGPDENQKQKEDFQKFQEVRKFAEEGYGHSWIAIPATASGKQLECLTACKDRFYLRSDNRHINDADLDYITPLPLKVLNLGETDITDEGLKKISSMGTLQSLILDFNPKITDKGVGYLSRMKNLQVLSLRQTSVTDAVLPRLALMPDLRCLTLSDCKGITNQAIVELAMFKSLSILAVSNTGITASGIASFQNCPRLHFLVLNNLKLNDADIVKLQNLNLRALLVDNNDLTDNMIEAAGRFPRLMYISVVGCKKITLPALLTLYATKSIVSDNDFYAYMAPSESLQRDHWAFWFDPEYHHAEFTAFMITYGDYYGYTENDIVFRNKLKGYLRDKNITDKLAPPVFSYLKQVDEAVDKLEQETRKNAERAVRKREKDVFQKEQTLIYKD